VTDDKDRRLLNTLLSRIYRPEILIDEPFMLSASGQSLPVQQHSSGQGFPSSSRHMCHIGCAVCTLWSPVLLGLAMGLSRRIAPRCSTAAHVYGMPLQASTLFPLRATTSRT
jgi:hypothetical protein